MLLPQYWFIDSLIMPHVLVQLAYEWDWGRLGVLNLCDCKFQMFMASWILFIINSYLSIWYFDKQIMSQPYSQNFCFGLIPSHYSNWKNIVISNYIALFWSIRNKLVTQMLYWFSLCENRGSVIQKHVQSCQL